MGSRLRGSCWEWATLPRNSHPQLRLRLRVRAALQQFSEGKECLGGSGIFTEKRSKPAASLPRPPPLRSLIPYVFRLIIYPGLFAPGNFAPGPWARTRVRALPWDTGMELELGGGRAQRSAKQGSWAGLGAQPLRDRGGQARSPGISPSGSQHPRPGDSGAPLRGAPPWVRLGHPLQPPSTRQIKKQVPQQLGWGLCRMRDCISTDDWL